MTETNDLQPTRKTWVEPTFEVLPIDDTAHEAGATNDGGSSQLS